MKTREKTAIDEAAQPVQDDAPREPTGVRADHAEQTDRESGERIGVVSDYCKGCLYRRWDFGVWSCDYIGVEYKRRGCPAGDGCRRRRLKGR